MTDAPIETGGEVVQLRPTNTSDQRFHVKRGGNHCQHNSRLVDDNARTVECENCKAVLDPFKELSRVAHDQEKVFRELEAARKEVATLSGRIELLKRLEDNARSRLKRVYNNAGAEMPDRNAMNEYLSGRLRAWVDTKGTGKVELWLPAVRLSLSPDEARGSSDLLKRLAEEAEVAK